MVVSIDVILNTQIQVVGETLITIIRNHDQLGNLDYENSGHTGFASTEDLEKLKSGQVSHVNIHAFEIDYTDNGYAQFLVDRFADGSIECKVGTFYNLYTVINKNEYVHKTFYLDKNASYQSLSDGTDVYTLESEEAIYTVRYSYALYDDSSHWSLFFEHKKVFADSEIFQTKANVADVTRLETQLELYTFNRSQIVAEYLSEYSKYIGQNVVAYNYTDYDRRTFEFLNKNLSKWGWLKEWLIACRTDYETNSARLQLLLDGDETFWSFEMWAFLNRESREEYPGATDYTLDEYANGWRPSTTLEKLNDDINEIGKRIPDPPTQQGIYYLEAVVDASGKPTYSWKKQ